MQIIGKSLNSSKFSLLLGDYFYPNIVEEGAAAPVLTWPDTLDKFPLLTLITNPKLIPLICLKKFERDFSQGKTFRKLDNLRIRINIQDVSKIQKYFELIKWNKTLSLKGHPVFRNNLSLILGSKLSLI